MSEIHNSPFLNPHQLIQKRTISRLEWDWQTPEYFDFIVDAVHYAYLVGVPGDIAEFGTMTGRSGTAISTAVSMLNRRYQDWRGGKHLHLFDSFEGLPSVQASPDLEMPYVRSGIWKQGACKGFSPDELKKVISNCLSPDSFSIHKGWFSDSVPRLGPNFKLAMLNVDGDLYQSTIDVLNPLFERGMISSGCMILLDDYDCNAAFRQLGERRAWAELCEKFEIDYSWKGSYGMASHAFIVHKYGSQKQEA